MYTIKPKGHDAIANEAKAKESEIPVLPPLFFPVQTIPSIEANSIIVAAASPNLEDAHPGLDGWLMSDFYAFNYLLKGLEASQTWLTLVEPSQMLSRWDDVKAHHHGHPAEDRRVIFSQDLLQSNEFTPVTLVEDTLTKRFLAEVSRASKEAVEKDSPLLILAFCHGLAEYTLVFDNDPKSPALMIQTLKEAVSEGCRATLVTPDFSGGWLITDLAALINDNGTSLPSTPRAEVSESWATSEQFADLAAPLLAGLVTQRFDSKYSPLLEDRPDPSTELYPDMTTIHSEYNSPIDWPNNQERSETYKTFHQAIEDASLKRSRIIRQHQVFNFAAQDDAWSWYRSGRRGVPLSYFQQRWNNLPPSSSDNQRSLSLQEMKWADSSQKRRLVFAVGQYLNHASPYEWSRGYGQLVKGTFNTVIDRDGEPEVYSDEEDADPYDPASMLTWRIDATRLAEYMAENLGLTFPSGKRCLTWSEFCWKRKPYDRSAEPVVRESSRLTALQVKPEPTWRQGPLFVHTRFFLESAMIDSFLDQDQVDEAEQKMRHFVEKMVNQCIGLAMEDPVVRNTGRDWLKAIGRQPTRSTSPE